MAVANRIPAPYNETFDSGWVRNGMNYSKTASAPDGTNTATALSLWGGQDRRYERYNLSVGSGNSVFSIFAKAGTKDIITVGFNFNSVGVSSATINLSTGQVIAVNSIVYPADPSNRPVVIVEDYPDGWKRISYGRRPSGSCTGVFYNLGTYYENMTWVSGTAMYVWGAKFTEGITADQYVADSAWESPFANILRSTDAWGNAAEDITLWDRGGDVTITSNATTAPDGTMTADLVNNASVINLQGPFLDGGTEHHVGSDRIAGNARYFLSAFFKAGTSDKICIGGDFSPTKDIMAYFNLTTKKLISIDTNVTVLAAIIVDYGNGWVRCGVIFTFPEASTDQFIHFDLRPNAGPPYSGSVYIWGVQYGVLPYNELVLPPYDAVAGFPGGWVSNADTPPFSRQFFRVG